MEDKKQIEEIAKYKRLTNKNTDEYNPEYDFCIGCKDFGEPNGCNRWNGACANYERFIETYTRLEELEDKIENGTLKELPENAVVLTVEEYERLYNLEKNYKNMAEGYYPIRQICDELQLQARRQTAREIIDMLVPDCEVCVEEWHKGCMCLRAKLAGKIAKRFETVEVEVE